MYGDSFGRMLVDAMLQGSLMMVVAQIQNSLRCGFRARGYMSKMEFRGSALQSRLAPALGTSCKYPGTWPLHGRDT